MHKATWFATLALVALVATVSSSAQQAVTVEGTLVDSSCYLGMNMTENDHGNMKACGTTCLNMGQPGGVVPSDGTFHAVIAPRSKARAACRTHGAHHRDAQGGSHHGDQGRDERQRTLHGVRHQGDDVGAAARHGATDG